ncbi:MAG: FAD binding domain-containing protein, partial [Veillonellales bacterium]
MATFQYACPETLTEAVGLASSNPGYSWIAGGTDFMVKLRLKRIEPSITIDIGRLEELRQIRLEKETLYIGAAVTHTELTTSPLIGQYAPALKEAAGMVGSPQIRNRGTVGGNICNASPAADTVPALLAYGAKVLICGKTGQRRLELADFCTGPGRTILKSGEFLREIYFPVQRLRQGSSFQKLGKRKALAISVVNAAAWL